jgi:hypothetical protein
LVLKITAVWFVQTSDQIKGAQVQIQQIYKCLLEICQNISDEAVVQEIKAEFTAAKLVACVSAGQSWSWYAPSVVSSAILNAGKLTTVHRQTKALSCVLLAARDACWSIG